MRTFLRLSGAAALAISCSPTPGVDAKTVSIKDALRECATHPALFFVDRLETPRRTVRIGPWQDGHSRAGSDRAPAVSTAGTWVAFASNAPSLVPADADSAFDVFLWNRLTRSLEHISIAPGGDQFQGDALYPALAQDAACVIFSAKRHAHDNELSTEAILEDIYVRDLAASETELLTRSPDGRASNGTSRMPSASSDGRWVAFQSKSTNLSAHDSEGPASEHWNVFLHDRSTGRTRLLSRDRDGRPGNEKSMYPDVSADGRVVVFQSGANNLLPGDTNEVDDIFLYDIEADRLELVSRTPTGDWPNERSWVPTVSDDGSVVCFESKAGDLVTDDRNGTWDIFVYERGIGTTERVNVAADGREGDLVSRYPTLSGNGRCVVFQSRATTLWPGDDNGTWDVFLFDRDRAALEYLSSTPAGKTGNGPSGSSWPSLSTTGRFVAFTSFATDLVP